MRFTIREHQGGYVIIDGITGKALKRQTHKDKDGNMVYWGGEYKLTPVSLEDAQSACEVLERFCGNNTDIQSLHYATV